LTKLAVDAEPGLYHIARLSPSDRKSLVLDLAPNHPELIVYIDDDADMDKDTVLGFLDANPVAVMFAQKRTEPPKFRAKIVFRGNHDAIPYMIYMQRLSPEFFGKLIAKGIVSREAIRRDGYMVWTKNYIKAYKQVQTRLLRGPPYKPNFNPKAEI
jgi:hypothetical protein